MDRLDVLLTKKRVANPVKEHTQQVTAHFNNAIIPPTQQVTAHFNTPIMPINPYAQNPQQMGYQRDNSLYQQVMQGEPTGNSYQAIHSSKPVAQYMPTFSENQNMPPNPYNNNNNMQPQNMYPSGPINNYNPTIANGYPPYSRNQTYKEIIF